MVLPCRCSLWRFLRGHVIYIIRLSGGYYLFFPYHPPDGGDAFHQSAVTGLMRNVGSDTCVGAHESDVAFKRKRPKVAELFLEPCPPIQTRVKMGGIPKSKLWTFTPKNELLMSNIFCLDADAGFK